MNNQLKQAEIINSSSCLIAYLDILGYRGMVKDFKKADFYFNAINNSIHKWKNDQKKIIPASARPVISVLSDSLIVALDLAQEESLPNGSLNGKKSKEAKVLMFLSLVSYLVLDLSLAVKRFFRGAIVCGKYYQNVFKSVDASNFIFSEGLCDAHDLGEEIADVPRIILDESALRLFPGKKPRSNNYALQDKDGLFYLNIYQRLFYSKDINDVNRTLEGFAGLLKKAFVQYEFHKTRDGRKIKECRRIHRKYAWFAHYHNEMFKQISQKLNNKALKN